MLVGYMRDSKADGSQTTDLQRDALLASGIDADSLYEDRASGKKDDRPQLAACLKALRHDDTLMGLPRWQRRARRRWARRAHGPRQGGRHRRLIQISPTDPDRK